MTQYLRDSLIASNVFCILSHGQKFQEKDVEGRCWELIEEETEEAVKSDEFFSVEPSVVESVVKREVLNATEVELFKAFDRWAIRECERQGMTSGRETKRQIFGEEIFNGYGFR